MVSLSLVALAAVAASRAVASPMDRLLPPSLTPLRAPNDIRLLAANMSDTVLLGSYSKSIHSLTFTKPTSVEAKDGKLVVGPSFEVGSSPSWVAQHPRDSSIVYAVKEDEKAGTVLVARLSEDRQSLEVLDEISTGGGAPAHCAVIADGAGLAVANYMSGSVTLIPLQKDGQFSKSYKPAAPFVQTFPFEASQSPLRNVQRQDGSHPHQIVEVGQEIWVPDLGGDKVWRLEIIPGDEISWKIKTGVEVKGDEGGGPRHILVSPDAQQLYVLNELLPALTHHTVSPPGLKQKISIVPPPPSSPVEKGTVASTAELLLLDTKPHKTIIASTRTLPDRDQDALAVFQLDESSGEVELKDFVFPRQGREFRAVGVSKCGKYVLVGGQEDGWISVFAQNEPGKWVEVVEQQVQLEKPTGCLFL